MNASTLDLTCDPRGEWPQADVLETYTTADRLERIDRVLRARLGSVTAVFEDVHDPHNVAACLRSAEAFGLQDVHLIYNQHGARLSSTVSKSADQWLTMARHQSTAAGVAALRQQGYEIWVSDLTAQAPLDALPIAGRRIALVVGNAVHGISADMRAAADQRYILPMMGMVQSFNLSVALALSLQVIAPRRRSECGGWGDLPMDRMWQLRRKWLEFGVRHADVIRRNLEGEPPSSR